MKSNHTKDVGRFMVAVGAIMRCKEDNTILLVKRADTSDFHAGEWEITFGRMSQFEEPEQALKREYLEEVGFNNFTVIKVNRAWHMFRGDRAAENELVGITFLCEIENKPVVKLSHEHSEYRWVTPEQALKLLENEGIKTEIQQYMNYIQKETNA